MEEEIIEFIKENEFLYNKRSRHYKNIMLRDNKFEELSRKMKIPAKKLKDRWRTLRDKFYRNLKNKKYPSRSGVISPRKKWKWIYQLMFLKDVEFSNENTSGNFPKETSSSSSIESFPSCSAFAGLLSKTPYSEKPTTSASTDTFCHDVGYDVFEESVEASTPQKKKKSIFLWQNFLTCKSN